MYREAQIYHTPVLPEKTTSLLITDKGANYLDATAGSGGHTDGILKSGNKQTKVIALDRDPDAIRVLTERFRNQPQVIIVKANYRDIAKTRQVLEWVPYSGILLDFGTSSHMIDDAARRGFSFQMDGPLDMRMDQTQLMTAANVINDYEPDRLITILRRYGELKEAPKIVRIIVENRPITRTVQLAELLLSRFGSRDKGFKIIRKLFQAIRIEVNDELSAIHQVLQDSLDLLITGGRVVALSYHSLEDRIVKHFIREHTRDCICPPRQPVCTCGGNHATLKNLTPKVIIASEEEIEQNPRAHSVKMRAFAKI